jgi:hypothetical protein
MKVHFTCLFPAGASMRCGIELPDPPTADSIRDVARVLMRASRVVRLPVWQHDGVEVDLLTNGVLGDENRPATAILRESLHRRTGTPLSELTDHRVYGIAVVCEPACWPRS